jgi:hypothetical protein
VDRIKMVVMMAEQYEQAVNALATLIVQWMTTRGRQTALRLVIAARTDQPWSVACPDRWTV